MLVHLKTEPVLVIGDAGIVVIEFLEEAAIEEATFKKVYFRESQRLLEYAVRLHLK
jgi:hypothetical protein